MTGFERTYADLYEGDDQAQPHTDAPADKLSFDAEGNPLVRNGSEGEEAVEADPGLSARLDAINNEPAPENLDEAIQEEERLLQEKTTELRRREASLKDYEGYEKEYDESRTVYEQTPEARQIPTGISKYDEALRAIRKKYKAIEGAVKLTTAGGVISSLVLAGYSSDPTIATIGLGAVIPAFWYIGRIGTYLAQMRSETRLEEKMMKRA